MKDQEMTARAEMEAARASAEKPSGNNRLPRRYRLYDKIKDRVSLRTVDLVIVITSVLLVAALVIGILTGSRAK